MKRRLVHSNETSTYGIDAWHYIDKRWQAINWNIKSLREAYEQIGLYQGKPLGAQWVKYRITRTKVFTTKEVVHEETYTELQSKWQSQD